MLKLLRRIPELELTDEDWDLALGYPYTKNIPQEFLEVFVQGDSQEKRLNRFASEVALSLLPGSIKPHQVYELLRRIPVEKLPDNLASTVYLVTQSWLAPVRKEKKVFAAYLSGDKVSVERLEAVCGLGIYYNLFPTAAVVYRASVSGQKIQEWKTCPDLEPVSHESGDLQSLVRVLEQVVQGYMYPKRIDIGLVPSIVVGIFRTSQIVAAPFSGLTDNVIVTGPPVLALDISMAMPHLSCPPAFAYIEALKKLLAEGRAFKGRNVTLQKIITSLARDTSRYQEAIADSLQDGVDITDAILRDKTPEGFADLLREYLESLNLSEILRPSEVLKAVAVADLVGESAEAIGIPMQSALPQLGEDLRITLRKSSNTLEGDRHLHLWSPHVSTVSVEELTGKYPEIKALLKDPLSHVNELRRFRAGVAYALSESWALDDLDEVDDFFVLGQELGKDLYRASTEALELSGEVWGMPAFPYRKIGKRLDPKEVPFLLPCDSQNDANAIVIKPGKFIILANDESVIFLPISRIEGGS